MNYTVITHAHLTRVSLKYEWVEECSNIALGHNNITLYIELVKYKTMWMVGFPHVWSNNANCLQHVWFKLWFKERQTINLNNLRCTLYKLYIFCNGFLAFICIPNSLLISCTSHLILSLTSSIWHLRQGILVTIPYVFLILHIFGEGFPKLQE